MELLHHLKFAEIFWELSSSEQMCQCHAVHQCCHVRSWLTYFRHKLSLGIDLLPYALNRLYVYQMPVEISHEARICRALGDKIYVLFQLFPAGAGPEEINRIYRKLAVLIHPDKTSLPGADEAFKLLGVARRNLLVNANLMSERNQI